MRDDEFEWDDRKAARNMRLHGVSFQAARAVFDDVQIVQWHDDNQDPSEDRFVALGFAAGRVMFVSYTLRSERIRIISARRAEPYERRMYTDGTGF